MGDMRLPGLSRRRVDDATIDFERAVSRFEQPHQDIHQGTLAAAGCADDADSFSLIDGEIKSVQNERQIRLIGKAHGVQANGVRKGQASGRRRG